MGVMVSRGRILSPFFMKFFPGLVETLRFQQIGNHLASEGTVPVPEPPLRFAMIHAYLLRSDRSSGVPQRRGRRLRAVGHKSVEKRRLRVIFHENMGQYRMRTEMFIPAQALVRWESRRGGVPSGAAAFIIKNRRLPIPS